MGPVIKQLRAVLPELPFQGLESSQHWTFDALLNGLAPTFYNKILPLHPLLNLEYSILCTQLREDFFNPTNENKSQILTRLTTALIYCELLEHLHLHYLVVPREVIRLRKQQVLFRTLLNELAGYTFATNLAERTPVELNSSLSQTVREATIQSNWYRILVNRSKRVVNLLNTVITNSQTFNSFIKNLDNYTNPALAYFGLFFHVPRLFTNLFILLKHTIPGPLMNEQELHLSWTTRLSTQIKRRWFEMSNDVVWTIVSAVNIFLLVGALATGAVYLSLAAFAFDVANAALRAFIELKRLYKLTKIYEEQLKGEADPEQQMLIRNHLKAITKRIQFEHLRFGIHISGTVLILAAMTLALPLFALSPPIVLASAIFLLLLWAITFALTRKLDNYRPNETIEATPKVSQFGFFAAKKPVPTLEPESILVGSLEAEGITISPALFI